jgi:putative ABC transport system permease protein
MINASELKNAVRGLRRSPALSLSAILCLALGIGATTAIASALSRALLHPLPFRDAEALVGVHRTTPQSGPEGSWAQSAPNFLDLAERGTQVTGLSALTWGTAVINLPDDAVQVSQVYVTGAMFQTLGAAAQAGRLLLPDDARDGAPQAVVISDRLWRARFAADPTAVGRLVSLDGVPTTVVGILPPDFRIPHGANVVTADVWSPLVFSDGQRTQRRSNFLLVLGRLADGATRAGAEAQLRGIFASIVAENPDLNGEQVRIGPLHAENVRQVRRPLLLLFGAVVMVLLIAATNVAALLLARGVAKQREVAVRAALGASRWDTVRPALAESVVLTGVSAIAGIAVALAGVMTIGLLAAARMPQLAGLHLDARVLAFALALTIVVSLVCGAAPAWRSAAVDPQDALRGGRGGGVGREHHRALRSLVVIEIALSLVLLIGAGLVLKGFASLLDNDPGFETERVLTVRVTASAVRYPNQTATRTFLEPTIAAIRAVPGVEAAGAISAVPYVTWGANGNTRYEGVPKDNPSSLPLTEGRTITPGFFDVTGQRLIAGRLLRESDDDRLTSPLVVVVNQALVDRDFKGRDPIGQRFHTTDTTFATIVGVVSDIRNFGPVEDPRPEMYWNYRQVAPGTSVVSVMVRTRDDDPMGVAGGVRAAVRSIDPTAAVADIAPMREIIARSLGRPRFYFALLGSFAAIALVLAVAGLYGVLSYAIAQRTREIGIRSALGSSRSALVRLFAMEGLRLVLTGIALGLVAGTALTRLMTFMLYGVSPLDVATWAAAAGLLLLAAMAASVIPARRAAKVSPIVAIQND